MQFKVEKMGCGGCANTISAAIRAVDPSAKIDVDLATKRVAVISGVDETAIRQVIVKAGFPAEPVA